MKCPICGGPMLAGTLDGVPGEFCPFCPPPEKPQPSRPVPPVRPVGHPDGTPLEREFLFNWRLLAANAPEPEREFKFAEKRKWRLDFCWRASLVAVECEGYGHGLENRYHGDVEKYNRLTAEGWQLFRCTMRMLRDDPASFVEMVRCAVERNSGMGKPT